MEEMALLRGTMQKEEKKDDKAVKRNPWGGAKASMG